MGLSTVDWSEVRELATAKIGSDIRPEEMRRVDALLNAATRYIYDESRYHPRFLVLEPRTAARGYVESTEDSFYVYGSGEDADGLYQRNGDNDGKPKYTRYASDGVTEEYTLEWLTGDSIWVIYTGIYNVIADALYTNSDTSQTPPSTGWSVELGESPAPRTQVLSEIDEIISYWNGARWVGLDPSEEYGYPDSNGFKLTTEKNGVTYVAYKKALNGPYGDGTKGTISAFPAEWLNYVAYSAARQYTASVRKEEGFNPVSLRDVERMESQVLTKANRQGAFSTIGNIFRTRYGNDRSISS